MTYLLSSLLDSQNRRRKRQNAGKILGRFDLDIKGRRKKIEL
jgi:hypothetical protein